ncbi:MAG: phosphatidylserine/phosphatidylglycerophosphate/cardiolipin synthase family protein [Cyanobacteriota bacterium]
MCKINLNNNININADINKVNNFKPIPVSQDKNIPLSKDELKITKETNKDSFSSPKILKSTMPNISFITDRKIEESKFTLNKDNSSVLVNLKIDIKDKDGINNFSKNDIVGTIKEGDITINGDIFNKAFSSLKGYKNQQGKRTTEIKDVYFDKKDNSYTLDVKVTQNITKSGIPAFWDNFQVKFKTDGSGKLSAKLEENWIFDSLIIGKLESTIKDKINSNLSGKYKGLSINVSKNKNEIVFSPEIKNMEINIGKNKSFVIDKAETNKAKFSIDNSGNVNIKLKDVSIEGSSSQNISNDNNQKPDFAKIELKAGIDKNNQRQMYSNGQLEINLDESETSKIKVGKEVLGHYLKSGTIENNFSLFIKQDKDKKPDIESKNTVSIKNASLDGVKNKVSIETDLSLSFSDSEGMTLETIKEPQEDFRIKTSNNGIKPIIGGANFFNEMSTMIQNTKESINLETFELKDDWSGNKVAYMMIKKSAGLETDDNKVSLDKLAPKGVDVKVIFNSWQGNIEEGEKTEKMLEKNITKVKDEIKSSSLPEDKKKELIDNIDKNMKYKFFTDGLLRSDHRKVFVTDGSVASVGGINMNDFHLGKDSAHDIMVKIAGPEVRNVQKEFLENWFEFNNIEKPNDKDFDTMLKSESFLTQNLASLQEKGAFKTNSKVGVLVTDDFQTDISKGILKLIDDSKKDIYIEQAFFTDSKINDKLKEAMKRGVNVNVIVAKNSLSSHIFNDANLYSAYQLLKEQKNGSAGKINLYYYDDTGAYNKHIHTKGISSDGERAIIGSANMVGRSLDTPFHKINDDGTKQNIMYNKEMSLYFEGSDAVKDIDNQLFKNDIKTKSKLITPDEMEEMVKQAGGESEIKKKFLMAFVT